MTVESMDEQVLEEILESAAARTGVAPAPVAAMRAGAARRRRRRWAGRLAACAAAGVLAAGGLTAVLGADDPSAPPVAGADDADAPPPGMRWVGIGHVAVAVPVGWSTNDLRCGVAKSDTVVVDQVRVDLCATAQPKDTVGVFVERRSTGFEPSTSTGFVDGVRVERSGPRSGGDRSCAGSAYVPSEDALFRVQSTRGCDAVSDVLDSLRVFRDLKAVPGYADLPAFPFVASAERYMKRLSDAGFEVRVTAGSSADIERGGVVGVEPAVGTMVASGSVVTITLDRRGEPD